MVVGTLSGMAKGGMHDHLGGGFHRYSVDSRWFLPHFEKMLYDQAQLAIAYLEAFQVTGKSWMADVAADVLQYVQRDMTDAAGGFFSAEDADSPDPDDSAKSREGAFYVWTKAEIDTLLSPEQSQLFQRKYGVEPDGNVTEDPHLEFTGRNILYEAGVVVDAQLSFEESKEILLRERSKRPRPHLDNKVLTAWNALMISAFAKGYVVLRRPAYLECAERAARFLLTTLYRKDSGLLLRRWCEGEAGIWGFLDDYAFFAQGLLDLFEATGKAEYLQGAVRMARTSLKLFVDKQNGGFYSSSEVAGDLIMRMKEDYDGAEPSGNSVATDVLLRLAHLTGDDEFREEATRSLSVFAPKFEAQPSMAPQMAVAIGRSGAEPEQIVIRCSAQSLEVEEIAAWYRREFRPWRTTLILSDEEAARLVETAPFLSSLQRSAKITIYECRNFACQLPQNIE